MIISCRLQLSTVVSCSAKMKDILTNFPFDQVGVWATVIVIFTYNVLLGRDMACTCKPQKRDCDLYMILPTFTVFFLMLWMDKKFQRVWRSSCGSTQAGKKNASNQAENPGNKQENGKAEFCRCACCTDVCCRLFCIIASRVIKASFISLLWVVSVLIDGDWYVCCQNDQSEQQAQLACKHRNNTTPAEKAKLAELKNDSKMIGFSILLGIVLAAAIMSCCPWRKCCCGRKCLYDKLILEEEKIVLTEILRTAAKEKLNDAFIVKIGEKKWEECFNVADELMKSDKPALSLQQTQQFNKLNAGQQDNQQQEQQENQQLEQQENQQQEQQLEQQQEQQQNQQQEQQQEEQECLLSKPKSK